MASLNNCQFIGNVGKIETKYMPNGDAICNLSLAVNESWTNKDGEKQESVEWVRCVMYKKIAEIAQQYVQVGSPIYLSGRMKTRKWTDKEGQERYTTEIVADKMQMLGSKPEVQRDQSHPAHPARQPEKQEPDFTCMDDEEIPF